MNGKKTPKVHVSIIQFDQNEIQRPTMVGTQNMSSCECTYLFTYIRIPGMSTRYKFQIPEILSKTLLFHVFSTQGKMTVWQHATGNLF